MRQSAYLNEANFEQVLSLARGATGEDRYGYRRDFIRLTEKMAVMMGARPVTAGE
jgi:hypothetical protein